MVGYDILLMIFFYKRVLLGKIYVRMTLVLIYIRIHTTFNLKHLEIKVYEFFLLYSI